MSDDDDRCPACHHWWVSHGSAPDPKGCLMTASYAGEPWRACGCQERPAPGSEWEKRLAREAAYQAEHYDRR